MRRPLKRTIIKLSKIKLLRKIFPSLNNFHKAYILKDEKTKILLDTKLRGYYRALLFWKWAPGKYRGGAILNLLGLSFVRYFYHNLKYRFRFLGKKFLYPELAKSGVELRPNLISADLVKQVLDFHQKYAKNVGHYFEDFSELVICNTAGPNQREKPYRDLIDEILDKAQIMKIGEELTGKKISIHPFISIIHYRSSPESKVQQDGQNIPHVDVFYPSYKIFVYLNEVTSDNGAFNYLVGSHVFSLKNAINYYKDTLIHYFCGGEKRIYPTDATLGLYKNDFKWLSAGSQPGDGVLFNVQGIHRRGEFKKDMFRERLVLLIDFRQVETPIQKLAANA